MVVLAQLVEHRIVVPSVVGSSPTFHPLENQHFTCCFFYFCPKNVPTRGRKNSGNLCLRTCRFLPDKGLPFHHYAR